MTTVSDELVERVARSIFAGEPGQWERFTSPTKEEYRTFARFAIAALSTPEFVLPLAEEMLRDDKVCAFMDANDGLEWTWLDAYRAAWQQ